MLFIKTLLKELVLLLIWPMFSEPYTRYTIWIRAFTDKHEGVPSQQMIVWTDVQPPGQPEIVSLTCQSGSTMFLRWVRPEVFYRTVDVYTVHYRARTMLGPELEWEQQLVETVNQVIDSSEENGETLTTPPPPLSSI